MRGKKDATTFPDKPVSWITSLFRGLIYIYIFFFFTYSYLELATLVTNSNQFCSLDFTAWTFWSVSQKQDSVVNPFHPNISMHILHTVPYTFSKMLMRRICFVIQSFFGWWPFPLFSLTLMCDLGLIL